MKILPLESVAFRENLDLDKHFEKEKAKKIYQAQFTEGFYPEEMRRNNIRKIYVTYQD